ncbi:hypothetical protein L7F22_061553 [Adiantum nelumboides]|nr:hypothetical protein [Adiantum nelumboides]
MVPLAEQIEKYCCGLSKGIKKYCTKTSVMNMAQLMENAEVADDLIQGKPDEDGFKTRRKEPQGKQFSAKGNVTSRLTLPPFKKKPFAGSKPFAGNRPFNTENRPNAENQRFRPPPFSGQRQGFKMHFTGKTIEERKALRDARKCYICEEEGHFANECPQRNSQNKDYKSDRKGKKPKPSAGLVPDLVIMASAPKLMKSCINNFARLQKKAVSTSHCSQPNTIEFEMAMEWRQLQEITWNCQMELFKKQQQELNNTRNRGNSKAQRSKQETV